MRVEVRRRYRIKVLREATSSGWLNGWEGTHGLQQLPMVLGG